MGALRNRYLVPDIVLTLLLLDLVLLYGTDGSLSGQVLHLGRDCRVRSLGIVYHLISGVIYVRSIDKGLYGALDVVVLVVLKRVLLIFLLLRLILLLLAVNEELGKRISTDSRLHIKRAQRSRCVNNKLSLKNF